MPTQMRSHPTSGPSKAASSGSRRGSGWAPAWADILADLLRDCKTPKKCWPGTLYACRRYGSGFAAQADAQGIAPPATSGHDVRRSFASQPREGKPTTLHDLARCVRVFVHFAQFNGQSGLPVQASDASDARS
jgi:hypothetical protein